MKAPVGLLSDRTVLHSKMEGLCPDKFAFVERSGTMKAPVGLLSDRTVLRSKMEGLCPDKFQFAVLVPSRVWSRRGARDGRALYAFLREGRGEGLPGYGACQLGLRL